MATIPSQEVSHWRLPHSFLSSSPIFSLWFSDFILFHVRFLFFLPFHFLKTFVKALWGSAKLSKSTESPRYSACPQPHSHQLLQLMNLHWHIMITQSPQLKPPRVHSWWCIFYRFWQMYVCPTGDCLQDPPRMLMSKDAQVPYRKYDGTVFAHNLHISSSTL